MRSLWEIALLVFVRRSHAFKINNVESGTVACGVGDVLGNKGAVGVSLQVAARSERLCLLSALVAVQIHNVPVMFVCSHLAARAERKVQRYENYQKIVRSMRLRHREFDMLNQYDHVLW